MRSIVGKQLILLRKEDSCEGLIESNRIFRVSEIQGALAECVGDLIILGGYLDSDHSLDSENTHYVLMAAKDIVQVACRSVRKALGYTYPMV